MQQENVNSSRTQRMRAISSNGVDMPVVQLAAHARSSTLYVQLYGCKSKFFWLDGLLLFRIIIGLHCACNKLHYKKFANR